MDKGQNLFRRTLLYFTLCSLILVACSVSATGNLPTLTDVDDKLMSITHTTLTPTATKTRRYQPPVETDMPTAFDNTPKVTVTSTLPLAPTTTPTATPTPSFHICSPLNGFPREDLYKIISNAYRPPPPGSDDRHQGVDFVFHRQAGEDRNILGVPVQSVMYGTVAAAVKDSFPFGNLVIIETPNWILPPWLIDELEIEPDESLYHLYAHMQVDLRVTIGQQVTSCQVIGAVGASGNTEAPHLHFETRIGPSGTVFPVMSAFVEGVTLEERANYILWRKSMVFRHFDPMRLMVFGIQE